MKNISLLIDDQVFIVDKDVLCEHSDYFRAMFSGNYVENGQNEIKIDVIDAESMKFIIRYMEIGLIDLMEHSLSTLCDLAAAANFLQITELIKQIQYTLETQISFENWMEIMILAETCSYKKLQEHCALFGLLSFNDMDPAKVPDINKLFWYLSHPYLNIQNELQVLKFGLQWVLLNEIGADALLILLGCLDLQILKADKFKKIISLIKDYENSLAMKVVECLNFLRQDHELSPVVISERKQIICEQFTERVFNEVLSLIKENRCRKLSLTPAIPVWLLKHTKPQSEEHYLYTFNEKTGLEKYLKVADKNLWGWNVVSWGPTRIVVVCGEHGRGSGLFMKDVKVYDTIKQEWTYHGVELPSQRHGGVAIVKDSLFLIGGVGAFRVTLDTVIIYDLKQRSFRKVASLPDAIQNPAVCSHKQHIYAACDKNIYRYEDMGNSDRWTIAANTNKRMGYMISFKEYIYCTQSYFSHLYRFRPGFDEQLMERINVLTNPPAYIFNLRDRLLFFTRTMSGHSPEVSAEEYKGQGAGEKPRVIWTQTYLNIKVNDIAGSCTILTKMPPLNPDVSQYPVKYLKRYCYYS